jgi:nicotinamide phosphoribosyltransferase
MNINPLTSIDFYKAGHIRQYPEGTTELYSNFTPRSCALSNINYEFFDGKVVFFGIQYFIKSFLIDSWKKEFFFKDKIKVIEKYKRRMDCALGNNIVSTDHIESLHDLGYLPLKIKALPEGSRVPIGVPVLTIVNTHKDFFWLTNYIETVMSCFLWKAITSATTAFHYKKLLTAYAINTGSPIDFVNFQAHDFSFRGMSGLQDASLSGAAHLTSFYGTDTVPAIDLLEDYYQANVKNNVIGCSVPATEHSVMCMGEKENEINTFKHLINNIYPEGIVSIVSDTWDFWKVINEYMNILKENIMSRNGKVVIRPDSGDPVKIICGDSYSDKNSYEYKGAIECLWDIFGGTFTENGYKVLDSHIGLIYGDAITFDKANLILLELEQKGFASSNIVFGIGSYTYQYVTRDTYGFAMKTTSGIVNGERREIFKDPKTDNGVKKSAKGLLRVEKENGTFVLYDQQTEDQEENGELRCIFLNGQIPFYDDIDSIRNNLDRGLIEECTNLAEIL